MTMPQPPVDDEPISIEPGGGLKLGKVKLPEGSTIYVIMAVIALIFSVGVTLILGVPKGDITTIEDGQLTFKSEVTSRVDAISSDLRASKDTITTNLATIPVTIDSKVNESVSNMVAEINGLGLEVKELTDDLDPIGKQASQALTKITELEGTINTLKTNIANMTNVGPAVATIETSVSTLKAQYDALKTEYDALKVTVAELEDVTPPTTTPPTSTTSGVTIEVTNPLITFAPADYKNAFNVKITNNNDKGIYGGQVSIALQVTGFPSGENVGTALTGTPLTSNGIDWRTPTLTTMTNQAYFIGDFTGYIGGNSSIIVTISVDMISNGFGSIFMNIANPSISGFTTF